MSLENLKFGKIPKLLETPKAEQYEPNDSKDNGKGRVMAFPDLISVDIPITKEVPEDTRVNMYNHW
jgi:hypothetical protein